MSCIVDNGLLQLVNEPTRIATATVLDLLIVNDPYFVYNVSVTTPFNTSDHNAISWSCWFPCTALLLTTAAGYNMTTGKL